MTVFKVYQNKVGAAVYTGNVTANDYFEAKQAVMATGVLENDFFITTEPQQKAAKAAINAAAANVNKIFGMHIYDVC